MDTLQQRTQGFDITAMVQGLYTDGIVGLKGAFSREWARRLGEDVATLFAEALSRPQGVVGRGPKRYYVEIHPERLRGFVELVTHPWVTGICEAVLGADWEVVEVGFDVPGPGARNQPWHRDFPSPEDSYLRRRLTSLAFNVTTVDVEPDMGPFEIAPGTQWEAGADFAHGMFPDRSQWARYEALAQRKLPRMGDISARTALTIHRGTENRSLTSRPVLILGVVAPGAIEDGGVRHDLQFTRAYFERLPAATRAHLPARLVDRLEPLVQAHTIEGLVMGAP